MSSDSKSPEKVTRPSEADDTARKQDQLELFTSKQADSQRLRKYIDQLVAVVFKQDEMAAMAVMNGLPRLQQDADADVAEVKSMSADDIVQLVKTKEKDIASLEEYIDELLARIVEHCPRLLETEDFLSTGP